MTKVNNHVFMTFLTRDKKDYWNKSQAIVIRDDGLVLPEFGKVFMSKEERLKAWNDFKAKMAKKPDSVPTESEESKKEIDEGLTANFF